jgi:hypothetical protein
MLGSPKWAFTLFDNRKSLIFKYLTYKSFKLKDLA